MANHTTLGEPFLVESYIASIPSESPLIDTAVTHSLQEDKGDGSITVTVASNGIHILDMADSHPVSSYTLGPSTQFACPAVTRVIPGNAESPSVRQRRTYAVIAVSDGIPTSERGRTIWMWDEPIEDGEAVTPTSVSREKKTGKYPFSVGALHVHEGLPAHILLVSTEGTVTVVEDRNLQVTSTSPPKLPLPGRDYSLFRSYVFTSQSCTFLSPRESTATVVVTALVPKDASPRASAVLNVMGFDSEGNAVPSTSETATIETDFESIEDITVDPSGNLSIISLSRQWSRFTLTRSVDGLSVNKAPVPLSFLPKLFLRPKIGQPHKATLSLLSLGNSHVLLATIIPTQPPEIVLMIWDLQYNVLLSEQKSRIPMPLSEGMDGLYLRLVSASPTQALLVVSSASKASTRSCILVVPYTVPKTSTIAAAVAKGKAGDKWLEKAEMYVGSVAVDGIPENEKRCLNRMASAVGRGDVDEADRILNSFLFEPALQSGPFSVNSLPEMPISHQFGSAAMQLLLKPPNKKSPAPLRTSATVLQLIRARKVSQSQVDGEDGLVWRLVERGDWSAVQLALSHVPDIPEDVFIKVLKDVLDAEQSSDQMDVDESTGHFSRPSLGKIVTLWVSYPATIPALRVAMKTRLTVEDATKLLEVLESMLESCVDEPLEAQLVDSAVDGKATFVQLLQILQAILDTFLLAFLQHPPSHIVLSQITAHILPEKELYDDFIKLKGPLEPFVRAEEARKTRKEPKAQPGRDDWMAKRKARLAAFEMTRGPYQIEELIF